MQIEFHGVSTEFYRLLWSAHHYGAHRLPWKYTIYNNYNTTTTETTTTTITVVS